MSTFPSKCDAWLVILLGATILIELVTAAVIWRGAAGAFMRFPLALVLASAALLIGWTLLRTDYVLDQQALGIRSGPLRWSIPLQTIRSVEPSRSALAGPALSLDRLLVTTPSKNILISPKDRPGFLAALAASDPALEQRGDRLVRVSSAASAPSRL